MGHTLTPPAVTRRIGVAAATVTSAFDSLPFGAGAFGGITFTYSTDNGPHRQLSAPAAKRKLEAPSV